MSRWSARPVEEVDENGGGPFAQRVVGEEAVDDGFNVGRRFECSAPATPPKQASPVAQPATRALGGGREAT